MNYQEWSVKIDEKKHLKIIDSSLLEMIIFGVDVPLVEILLVFTIITGFVLLEAIILVALLLKAMNKGKGNK